MPKLLLLSGESGASLKLPKSSFSDGGGPPISGCRTLTECEGEGRGIGVDVDETEQLDEVVMRMSESQKLHKRRLEINSCYCAELCLINILNWSFRRLGTCVIRRYRNFNVALPKLRRDNPHF